MFQFLRKTFLSKSSMMQSIEALWSYSISELIFFNIKNNQDKMFNFIWS